MENYTKITYKNYGILFTFMFLQMTRDVLKQSRSLFCVNCFVFIFIFLKLVLAVCPRLALNL